VPQADNLLNFAVRGGRLVGVDNGRQESAESFKAQHRTAFHGKALAIVTPSATGMSTAGKDLVVTATGAGLSAGTISVRVAPAEHEGERERQAVASGQGFAPVTWFTPGAPEAPVPAAEPGVSGLTADASFSGSEDTAPASMVDGITASGGWSDAYTKTATPLLPRISAARPADWVSLAWTPSRRVTGVTAWFTVDTQDSLPASVSVLDWGDHGWQPATGVQVAWAAGSNQPTSITFDGVSTTRLRLVLTSSHAESPNGFVKIAELAVA
jgi:beta-galactosidase